MAKTSWLNIDLCFSGRPNELDVHGKCIFIHQYWSVPKDFNREHCELGCSWIFLLFVFGSLVNVRIVWFMPNVESFWPAGNFSGQPTSSCLSMMIMAARIWFDLRESASLDYPIHNLYFTLSIINSHFVYFLLFRKVKSGIPGINVTTLRPLLFGKHYSNNWPRNLWYSIFVKIPAWCQCVKVSFV